MRSNVPHQPPPAPDEIVSDIVPVRQTRLTQPISLPQNVNAGVQDFGTTLAHYEIIRPLGRGGMGSVFLARDTKLGRLVAIKVLLGYGGHGALRFLEEARTTALCRHENIVVVYEVDEFQGTPYMVLEYLEGQTLRAWMTEQTQRSSLVDSLATPPLVAVDHLIPVVRALVCAHSMGIVHRDLKPENVLLTYAGQVKVLDFGIAKRIDVEARGNLMNEPALDMPSGGLTQEGALIGTLAYMSPEQWRMESVDGQTDIWAVGIMLYELVTGAHPLDATKVDVLRTIANVDLPLPSVRDVRPDIGALGEIIDGCLKKRKDERFSTAKELLDKLEGIAEFRTMPGRAEDECPFAGLSAFQETDAARFFGRDQEVASVVGALKSHEFVTIAGPSGAGKSSLVRAGVIPQLKRSGEHWIAFVLRPGRRPLVALAEILARLTAADISEVEDITAMLHSEPGYLGAKLRAWCRLSNTDQRVLLFVDQLEELYTLGIEAAERRVFLDALQGVADDPSSPLRVVLTIRSDFLDRVAEDRRFMNEIVRGLRFLPPMGRNDLRQALTKPLEEVGYRFERDETIDEMLDALEQTRSPLPLLQFAATQLWQMRDRDKRLFTVESYATLGGVAGALSTHADAMLQALSAPEQSLVRAVALRLITPERTRAIVSLRELRELGDDPDAAEQVVRHLANAHLLLFGNQGAGDEPTVELIHESLIERWAKLGQWVEENRQDAAFVARLRVAAQQWEASGETEGLLWRNEAAKEAQRFFKAHAAKEHGGATINKREERFLLAVVALAKRARRRQGLTATGVIVALAAFAVVVSYMALRADRAATLAKREARQARNATLVSAAREMQADPTTMLALLREVEPPDVPHGWSELTRWALQTGVARVILEHPDGVMAAAWSPDGQRIVTASQDKVVRVWNADGTGKPREFSGHTDDVRAAAWSPDGQRIATGSIDNTVRIWNADGVGEPIVLGGHTNWVRSVAWSPDGKRLLTASHDYTARIWNADYKAEPLVFRGHASTVLCAAWSFDGKKIVTGSQDQTVRVWNADGTGGPLVLKGHTDNVWGVAFSPDGRHIATASDDKTVRVWNADGTGEPAILYGHTDTVRSVAYSPDGQRILTGSDDSTARVWNVDGYHELRALRGHASGVAAASWSPDGRSIVTASRDGSARIYNADESGAAVVLRGHDDEVLRAAWSSDGQSIATVSADHTMRIHVTSGKTPARVFRGHTDWVTGVAWSPDGTRLATSSLDATIRFWNADGTGNALSFRGPDALYSVAWSPDGRRIASATGDGKGAWIWNVDGHGAPMVLDGFAKATVSAAFSPDGQRVVVTSDDRTARVWNADGSGEPITLSGHEREVVSAAFSQDGRRIATASTDRTVRIWNADGLGEPLILRGHEDGVTSCAWSPDGSRIVTASRDKTVRVWNTDNGSEPLVLRGDTRAWDADGTGDPLVLRGASDAYNDAAFSPDGKSIVGASRDKTVWVWSDLEPMQLSDPQLWTATTYCLPVDLRLKLLNVTEATARADLATCLRGVRAARSADEIR